MEESPAVLAELSTKDALVAELRGVQMPALISQYRRARANLEAIAREAAPYRIMLDAIEQVWQEQLLAQGGTHLPTGDESITVYREPGKSTPVRNNLLLRELLLKYADEHNIARAEVNECVDFEPPKPPELRSSLTALKALVKKYGEPIQKIMDRCVERRFGPSRFIVSLGKESTDDYPD